MLVKSIVPFTPLACNETGVYREKCTYFFIFDPKQRMWVHVRTAAPKAVLTCVHNQCFEQKYLKYRNGCFYFYLGPLRSVTIFRVFKTLTFRNIVLSNI